MPDTNVVDAPVTPKTEQIPNPVLPSDIDLSKALFNKEMGKVKGAGEPVNVPEPETKEVPTTEVKKEEAAPEPKSTIPEDTVETKDIPSNKGKIPEELLSGKKEESKVPDELAEIEAMTLPKNAKPEQVASFAKLKEQSRKVIEEKLARITELEAKTSDASTKAEIEAAQARIKEAEEKAKELESTVERLAFYESPKYKQFVADEEAQLASAKSYFQGTEVNPEIIEVAARSAGPNRIRILKEAGLDSDTISAVAPYLASFDTIQRAKSSALENWKTTSAQYAEQQKAQQEAANAQRQAEEQKAWESVISKSRNEIAPFRKFDNHEDWNTRADQLVTKAQQIFNGEGVSLTDMADVIAKGVAYDALDEVRADLTSQLKLLREENAKLKAAKPDGGSGQGANGAKTEPSDPIEAAKSTFNRELARAKGQ